MQPLDLLLGALATWIVAYFVSNLDAPFDLMVRFRKRFPFGGLWACVYCTGLWAALVIYLLMATPARPAVNVLAVWGAALLLHRYTGGNHL